MRTDRPSIADLLDVRVDHDAEPTVDDLLDLLAGLAIELLDRRRARDKRPSSSGGRGRHDRP